MTDTRRKTMAILQRLLMHWLLVTLVKADPDAWLMLNNADSTNVIATNNRALYYVDSKRELKVFYSDEGFIYIGQGINNFDVNDDLGLWISTTHKDVLYQTGVTSSNLIGIAWLGISGIVEAITTGRYGLVLARSPDGHIWKRLGITSSLHYGTVWQRISGSFITGESCSKRVCFVVNSQNQLFTTGLMENIDSPTWYSPWIFIYPNVKDISAYGDKTLWKLDVDGLIWEGVNVYDNNFIKLTWERRGYQQTTFKDVAVTDKKAYAVGTDGNIYVYTGCPIFDFEDNDLSEWEKTGTAFNMQPTFSQATSVGAIGKVGKRCIDTVTSSENVTVGDTPVGTATSPLFQIRTHMLHFTVGGGTHPNNYVGLVIDGVERYQSSGRSKPKVNAAGPVRMGRFWWDVSGYMGKCASIKMVDSSNVYWGHTLFDDLRASPPCFKGMNVVLRGIGHQGTVSVGQVVKYSLELKGFYTSSLRPLIVTVSVPVVDRQPVFIIENLTIASKMCNGNSQMNRERLYTASGHTHSITANITNLLSDATVEIVARVYDNSKILIGSPFQTKLYVTAMFMEEYLHTMEKNVQIVRHGNESASLTLQSEIIEKRHFTVGENVTFIVKLTNNYNSSLIRAYKVSTKITVPEFMTIANVSGLKPSFGDVDQSLSGKSRSIWLPEILLGHSRAIVFTLTIGSISKWKKKEGRIHKGEILLDQVYFCPRKDCLNEGSTGNEIKSLASAKFYEFTFSYNGTKRIVNGALTRIYDRNASVLFVCVRYDDFVRKIDRNCYYGNLSTNSWHPLSNIMANVTYYDKARKELFGFTASRRIVTLFGEQFFEARLLLESQCSELGASEMRNILKSSSVTFTATSNRSDSQILSSLYRWHCCT